MEIIVDIVPDVLSPPVWVPNGVENLASSMEIPTVEVTEGISVPELVNSDGVIAVLPGEKGSVDLAELGCSTKWVTDKTLLCGFEGIAVGKVIISGTPDEMVIDKGPEVASISELVSNGILVSA